MDDTGWHGEPVKVPPFVLEGIQAVQTSGKVDTFDSLAVECLAVRLGYPQTVRWIKVIQHCISLGCFTDSSQTISR